MQRSPWLRPRPTSRPHDARILGQCSCVGGPLHAPRLGSDPVHTQRRNKQESGLERRDDHCNCVLHNLHDPRERDREADVVRRDDDAVIDV